MSTNWQKLHFTFRVVWDYNIVSRPWGVSCNKQLEVIFDITLTNANLILSSDFSWNWDDCPDSIGFRVLRLLQLVWIEVPGLLTLRQAIGIVMGAIGISRHILYHQFLNWETTLYRSFSGRNLM